MSDSPELLKPDEVTDSELQSEIGNLRQELERATLQIHGYQDAEIRLKENYAEASAKANIWGSRLTKCQETLEKRNKELEKARRFFAEEHTEREKIQADYDKLLESSTHVTNKLKEDMANLRSQLRTETADREELETELSDLREKSATATKDLPEAATILSKLRGKRKKSKADLADVEVILEIIEES